MTINPFQFPTPNDAQILATEQKSDMLPPESMVIEQSQNQYSAAEMYNQQPVQQEIQPQVMQQPNQQPMQPVQQEIQPQVIQQTVQQPIQPVQQEIQPQVMQQTSQQPMQSQSASISNFVFSTEATVVPPINQQINNINSQTQQIQPDTLSQVNSTPTQQPLSIVTSQPPTLENGQELICSMTPGTFDSFIKVISLLDEKSIINITQSKILQLINNNTTILQTNISQLCGNKEIDLHILKPKDNIRLFKAIKDNNDVYFVNDIVNKRFQIISGDIRIWLPKQIEEIAAEVTAPSFSIDQIIGEAVIISKEERSKIISLTSGNSAITLLLNNNQLMGYLIPEKVEATFKQFTGHKISEKSATLKLISSSLLNIPSDGDTVINIAKQGDNYWMITKINTAMVEIILLESLTISTDEVLLL